MKIYLIRDKGTECEDNIYTLTYNDDCVGVQDFIDRECLENGKIRFTDYQEESNSNCVEHSYENITGIIGDDENNYPLEKGSALELFPGPFDKIDSFCQDLCFMGLGSESCKDCPLAEAKKIKRFIEKEEK